MSLSETQRRLAEWIRAPEGVEKAIDGDGRAASSAVRSELESLIRSDATLDAVSRLEIYANAYFYRVLGVLAEDYEALRGLLGETDFHDLVTSYLFVEPSRHPSLRYAGQRLPDFLATHPAAAGIRSRTAWAPDLARFEWARVDAFDAPDAPTLRAASLAERDPNAFASLVLQLAPGAQILEFDHAVDALWRAGVRGEEPIFEAASVTTTVVLVWRKQERVVHRRPDAHEAAAIRRLRGTPSFGDLCDWAATRVGEDQAPALAAGWLGQWLADDLLRDAES